MVGHDGEAPQGGVGPAQEPPAAAEGDPAAAHGDRAGGADEAARREVREVSTLYSFIKIPMEFASEPLRRPFWTYDVVVICHIFRQKNLLILY